VADIEIRSLQPGDDRSRFGSGDVDLDRFFHRFAGQNQFRHHTGVTYVAIQAAVIVGYATVAASSVEAAALPPTLRRRLPEYPLPVLRLARLAVDERFTGSGVGLALLRAVFGIAHSLASSVGCIGVVVDAKPQAVEFYERYGFFSLGLRSGGLGDRPEPTVVFLPLQEIPRSD
jgi:GNAT superfamily N-acetyltransferase